MKFRIHLFLAILRLLRRALRVRASAYLLGLSASVLGLSKRLGPPPPTKLVGPVKTEPPDAPMTVEELLSAAQRHRDSHFILRMPGLLIEITQVDEALETAAFNSGSEGHCWTRKPLPFFAKSRRRSIKGQGKHSLEIPPPGFLQ